MTDTSTITRRSALKGLGLVAAATTASAAVLAEHKLPPRERIDALLSEMADAMGELYEGATIRPTFNGLRPEHVLGDGSIACLMVLAW